MVLYYSYHVVHCICWNYSYHYKIITYFLLVGYWFLFITSFINITKVFKEIF
eukprot:UN10724